MLELQNISFIVDTEDGGKKSILKDISVKIDDRFVAITGPNGGGKSTLAKIIAGIYTPTSGTVELNGQDVTKMAPHNRVKIGISRTFQNIRLFKRMSVLENVKVSSNVHMNYGIFAGIFKTKKYFEQEDKATKEALEILEVLGLSEYANEQAQNLPYGKQRKLEIARALASHPSILCLDEPAAGMNPIETEELMETIKIVREKFNTAILLIEHDMKLVMGICEWIKVISFGKEIATGTPSEIKNNKEVIAAYLGE